MNRDCIPLAKKYAIAYFNIFKDKLTEKDALAIQAIADFFEKNNSILFFLKLPVKFQRVKMHIIKRLSETMHLSKELLSLVDLLLEQQRLYLFPNVCRCIKEVFDEKNNILNGQLETSHHISDKQVAALKQFFEDLIGKKIEFNVKQNPHLIGGVRLHADTLLWEYSIQKQLRNAERLLSNGD
jgi:F-type H+-transporting ATPase subunit delta